jgi:hypothetical protein
MWGRLTALLLICALGASVAAGAALPHEEHACPMHMADGAMDCCVLAELQTDTPEVTAARLCCAFNCTQGAPPGRNIEAPRAQQTAQAPHPVAQTEQPHAHLLRAPFVAYTSPAAHSPPAYIQHAALLI